MERKKIHSICYVIGILAAIAIGIDCAINAFIYMSMAGGFYVIIPLIIACCIATFILNGILYFQDTPEAFQDLYNDIGIPSLKSLKSMKFWVNGALYLIAVSSAVTIAAFTYYSYLSLPATVIVIPHALIIIFCLAYMCGTFAILKAGLEGLIKNESGEYEFTKVINSINKMREVDQKNNTNKFYKFLALTIITIAGCIFTQLTILQGLQAALIILSPQLSVLAIPMFALYLLAELAFTINTMLYIVDKLDPSKFKSIAGAFAFVAIMLNAICNAAITKASISQMVELTQSLGFILSATVMIKYIEEFMTRFLGSDDQEQWNNVYNAIFFVEHMVVMLSAVFLINTFAMPIIIPAVGTLGAFVIGSVALAAVFAIDQAIDIHISGYAKTPKAQILDAKKSQSLETNKRVPLVVQAVPSIGSFYKTFTSGNTANL